MADDNSAQEPTNFPVGNRDEVPSESPEKVESPQTQAPATVPNDTPAQDVQEAREARNAPAAEAAPGGSIESPSTDPNRANARPAAEQADKKL